MTGRPRSAAGPHRVCIVGPGRAGGSFARVFAGLGWQVAGPVAHGDDLRDVADETDLVVLAVPDRAVSEAAAAITPHPDTLVIHVAGSLGLDVLAGHPRRGALHPLVSLPDPSTGAARLVAGAWFAVDANDDDGRALLGSVVEEIGGHAVTVADRTRAAYHAAAVVASNHLVALCGQVERIAASTGVPFEAFLSLSGQTLEGVASLGPAAALTGPARRGDWETVGRHLEALAPDERPAYAALAELAARLVPDADADAPPGWLAAARRGGGPERSVEGADPGDDGAEAT